MVADGPVLSAVHAEPPALSAETLDARRELIALGARYHRAGWLFGTSGNLSARVATPGGERVVVTASGRDKGALTEEDFVELDLAGRVLAAGLAAGTSERARPSAEATIHLALYRTRPGARVALHVHTVASALADPDGAFAARGSSEGVPHLGFSGLEIVKGWDLWEPDAVAELPVFANWPEVPRIADAIERFYRAHPEARVPALLIARHGITAWGADPATANRHLEVTEFLCQVALARRR